VIMTSVYVVNVFSQSRGIPLYHLTIDQVTYLLVYRPHWKLLVNDNSGHSSLRIRPLELENLRIDQLKLLIWNFGQFVQAGRNLGYRRVCRSDG
jgi:hypothetical protein